MTTLNHSFMDRFLLNLQLKQMSSQFLFIYFFSIPTFPKIKPCNTKLCIYKLLYSPGFLYLFYSILTTYFPFLEQKSPKLQVFKEQRINRIIILALFCSEILAKTRILLNLSWINMYNENESLLLHKLLFYMRFSAQQYRKSDIRHLSSNRKA